MQFLKQLSVSDRVAIIALVLAILSIGLSIWTAVEQKRQWRATSLGRVEMTKAEFLYWRTMPEAEARALQWGYAVNLMPLLEGNRVSGLLGLPSRLVAFQPATRRAFPLVTGITRSEFEAARAAATDLPADAVPAKHFQIQTDFLNTGATAISDLVISIDSRLPGSVDWSEGAPSQPIALGPGRTVFKLAEFFVGLDQFLPDKLRFRARLSFNDVDGKHREVSTPFYFHSPTGAFNLGE